MSKKTLIWTALVLLLLLAVICILTHARKIENKLTLQAQDKLAAAGISGLSVKFDGRNAILSGEVDSDELSAKAAALIAEIPGVRKVSNLAAVKPQQKIESAQATETTAMEDALVALKNSLAKLSIHFDTNSDKISSIFNNVIDQIAQLLKKYQREKIEIIGHADSRGTEEYNQKLSLKRASSVKSVLVKNGIDASRLLVSGKGESDPIADNATAEGMAKNRRVEFIVIEEE
ncbi:MAG: OmpA family protein [Calditrichaeota bacterium]|nr:OmpA family protein [Calditrichota bacterium]